MTDTVTVANKFHGPRVWQHVETTRITAEGRRTTRSTWESVSGCIICGERFCITVQPPSGHDFGLVTCKRHRFTKSESMRLRRASDDGRPAMLETIKKAKLERTL
jgi:hypothetical protein